MNTEAKTEPGIPGNIKLRNSIRLHVDRYVREKSLVPPASLGELREHAADLLERAGENSCFRDFTALLVNNALWRETVARVPYDRRVLLLPQCLRNEDVCKADKDEFGLLCMQCGGCCIGRIQAEAEKLGYIVLIAEGTTVVTKLLASGKVDAVMGASCMDVLEKTFPFLVSGAIPGVALPLLRNGCRNTEVDESWIMDAIHLSSEKGFHPYLNIDELKEEVQKWFRGKELCEILGPASTLTEQVAFDWLSCSGKRWRPFLAAAVYGSLSGTLENIPEEVRRVCIAIECFHKASLIHDDIADKDDYRYGMPTLHKEHGMPFALNVGDFLVGLGYRLLATCGLPAERNGVLVNFVSLAHSELCIGQGKELALNVEKEFVTPQETIEIFRLKTSPSFRAALLCGAVCARCGDNMLEAVSRFSNSLGVAYQIRDDLDDFEGEAECGDGVCGRLSLLLSLAYERITGPEEKSRFVGLLRKKGDKSSELNDLISRLKVRERARQMMEHYRQESLRCLTEIDNAPLNELLRKLVRRIVK